MKNSEFIKKVWIHINLKNGKVLAALFVVTLIGLGIINRLTTPPDLITQAQYAKTYALKADVTTSKSPFKFLTGIEMGGVGAGAAELDPHGSIHVGPDGDVTQNGQLLEPGHGYHLDPGSMPKQGCAGDCSKKNSDGSITTCHSGTCSTCDGYGSCVGFSGSATTTTSAGNTNTSTAQGTAPSCANTSAGCSFTVGNSTAFCANGSCSICTLSGSCSAYTPAGLTPNGGAAPGAQYNPPTVSYQNGDAYLNGHLVLSRDVIDHVDPVTHHIYLKSGAILDEYLNTIQAASTNPYAAADTTHGGIQTITNHDSTILGITIPAGTAIITFPDGSIRILTPLTDANGNVHPAGTIFSPPSSNNNLAPGSTQQATGSHSENGSGDGSLDHPYIISAAPQGTTNPCSGQAGACYFAVENTLYVCQNHGDCTIGDTHYTSSQGGIHIIQVENQPPTQAMTDAATHYQSPVTTVDENGDMHLLNGMVIDKDGNLKSAPINGIGSCGINCYLINGVNTLVNPLNGNTLPCGNTCDAARAALNDQLQSGISVLDEHGNAHRIAIFGELTPDGKNIKVNGFTGPGPDGTIPLSSIHISSDGTITLGDPLIITADGTQFYYAPGTVVIDSQGSMHPIPGAHPIQFGPGVYADSTGTLHIGNLTIPGDANYTINSDSTITFNKPTTIIQNGQEVQVQAGDTIDEQHHVIPSHGNGGTNPDNLPPGVTMNSDRSITTNGHTYKEGEYIRGAHGEVILPDGTVIDSTGHSSNPTTSTTSSNSTIPPVIRPLTTAIVGVIPHPDGSISYRGRTYLAGQWSEVDNGVKIPGGIIKTNGELIETSPTPTLSPVLTPLPIPVSISLDLPGIGNTTGENNSPKNSSIDATLALYKNKELFKAATDVVTFQDGVFKGNITFQNIPTGLYDLYIKTENSLYKKIGTKISLTPDQAKPISQTIEVVTGDLNSDNRIDLLDYNIFSPCTGNKLCKNRDAADLNSDGKVDEVDLNIMLRGMSIQTGDTP